MAQLDKLGAFALTEPTHGSDSVALETSARRDGDTWVINGAKKWIGNGTIADVVVVWARDDGRRPGQGLPGREGHPRLRRAPDRRARARCGRSGRPRSPSPTCGCPRRTGCPARTASRTPARCWPAPATRSPGRALGHATAAYEIAVALLRGSAPSSASRWSASRSCRTGWSRCSPRSARCSCTACGSAG